MEVLASKEATRRIPSHLLEFLEEHIEWLTPAEDSIMKRDVPTESQNVVGEMVNIHC